MHVLRAYTLTDTHSHRPYDYLQKSTVIGSVSHVRYLGNILVIAHDGVIKRSQPERKTGSNAIKIRPTSPCLFRVESTSNASPDHHQSIPSGFVIFWAFEIPWLSMTFPWLFPVFDDRKFRCHFRKLSKSSSFSDIFCHLLPIFYFVPASKPAIIYVPHKL